jgi:hypothetical protein
VSIGALITHGIGPGGSVKYALTGGLDIGGVVIPPLFPGGGGDRRARLRRFRLIQSGNAQGSTITVAIEVISGRATGGTGPLKVLDDLDVQELAMIMLFAGDRK